MNIDGVPYRTIWVADDGWSVEVIDQTLLPHRFAVLRLRTLDDAVAAIADMNVRGAPLIGATAAYGVCLALRQDPADDSLEAGRRALLQSRPTAVNLAWALEQMAAAVLPLPEGERVAAAYAKAGEICDDDVAICRAMGEAGLGLIHSIHEENGGDTVDILTHCNAGWLATVDWGTALAPVYAAHDAGVPVHVWVDETRPRNQGAALTAWELGQHGVPHTVIADNAGGHLMQAGRVDLCITGTDRTAANGDVCNKIGTYLKALAARDNGVPFYVALPGPTIDWRAASGIVIPIEERAAEEVTHIRGAAADGEMVSVRLTPKGSPAANPAFDVTPARLITGLITERGITEASAEGLATLYPERLATTQP
ncbi:MAG TPA: S-methyl-5-thioribose-1-phosphate isomerase [Alphaproteobacteria bacterium]|nr:S-methyl-5-thioribose-1-phosphate isomerase [Alphaproteobacteria bacterium]